MSAIRAQDLYDFIDHARVECLNQSPQHTIKNALTKEADDSYLESDTDEQVYCDRLAVKVHSLQLKVPEEGSGPKHIKLFVNRPSMGFAEATDSPGTQEFDLTLNSLKQGTPIQLRFVKFQNVNCLSLFIESNQDEKETTVVSWIKILGYSGEVMDVANIKKTTPEDD